MLPIVDVLLSLAWRSLKAVQPDSHSKKKGQSNNKLTVIDSRTSKSYDIPITDNTMRAIDFRHISTLGLTASPLERYHAGLHVMDSGFQNTAVVESEITYMYVFLHRVIKHNKAQWG